MSYLPEVLNAYNMFNAHVFGNPLLTMVGLSVVMILIGMFLNTSFSTSLAIVSLFCIIYASWAFSWGAIIMLIAVITLGVMIWKLTTTEND